MPDTPERVYFFADEFGDMKRPAVTIYEDGTYKEHRPLLKAKKGTIYLSRTNTVGPNRIQLDMAERFASAALISNPNCIIEFGAETSPWSYDWAASAMGKQFAFGLAGGKELKWGRKGSSNTGPLRKRKKPKYKLKERK